MLIQLRDKNDWIEFLIEATVILYQRTEMQSHEWNKIFNCQSWQFFIIISFDKKDFNFVIVLASAIIP